MEERKNPIADLSEEEVQKEDAIREMLDSMPELKEIHVSEEAHERLMARIQKYEEEKALASLSEEKREALRLGMEVQERRQRRRKSKKFKLRLALAAAMVMVIGVGVTSIGDKNIIVDVFERKFWGGEKTYVDTVGETLPTEEGSVEEDEAYSEIEKAFNTKVVRITAKPTGMKFLEMQLDEIMQEAIFYYSLGDKMLSFRMIFAYAESSSGFMERQDPKEEYEIALPETTIKVTGYENEGVEEIEYNAQFSYESTEYFLSGTIEQKEFDKIIKNLLFF